MTELRGPIDETATARAPRAGRPSLAVVAVLMLLLLGASLRSVRLDEPPLAFHATRQYSGALLARKYEQMLGGNAGGFSRTVVRDAAPKEIEPPMLEVVTAVAWRLFGDEPLWFPQAVSILVWSIGGWLLFLLLRRLASAAAGVAGVAVWSFLPFSVTASRTFQPDPLMVAALAGAVLALVVHDDEPSNGRLVSAGLAGGFAVLVKSPAIFFVAPVFVALAFRRGGLRELWSRRTAVYAALVAAPALLYAIYGFWIGGFLRGQEGNRIVPHLLVTETFWRGWAHLGLKSFGVVVPMAALAGVLLARGRARQVGVALFAGYVGFGLVFTYHYMTHDYYHLPFVLVLSVGIGLLADRVLAFVRARRADMWSIAVAAAVALVVLVGFRVSVESVRFGLVPASIPEATRIAETEVPPKIGTLLHHSTRLAFLAPSFGETLQFYGGVAGRSWPETNDAQSTLAEIRRKGAEFFVVTDLRAWAADPDLRNSVTRYPLLASDRNFLVYDLRGFRR